MGKRTISMGLSVASIQSAIKELRKYENWLTKKAGLLVEELAKVGIPVIDSNMAKANYTYDSKGIRSGSDTTHNTYVELSWGNQDTATAKLIVKGEELMFIEFGAGVYYNGSVGNSPHPMGAVNGMVIGSYGKGHGVQKVWGYYDDTGKLVLTHGVEAQMPVYKAENEIMQRYIEVARRVFK